MRTNQTETISEQLNPAQFGNALFESAVQNPWNSVCQLANSISLDLPKMEIVHDVDSHSLAAKVGTALGFGLDMAVLSKLANPAFERMHLGYGILGQGAKLGITGGLYGGVFTPAASWNERMKNSALDAATFGAMGVAAGGLGKLSSFSGDSLASRVKLNAVAGTAGGVVDVQGHSIADGQGLAGLRDTGIDAANFAVLGGAFGAADFGMDAASDRLFKSKTTTTEKISGHDTPASGSSRKETGSRQGYGSGAEDSVEEPASQPLTPRDSLAGQHRPLDHGSGVEDPAQESAAKSKSVTPKDSVAGAVPTDLAKFEEGSKDQIATRFESTSRLANDADIANFVDDVKSTTATWSSGLKDLEEQVKINRDAYLKLSGRSDPGWIEQLRRFYGPEEAKEAEERNRVLKPTDIEYIREWDANGTLPTELNSLHDPETEGLVVTQTAHPRVALRRRIAKLQDTPDNRLTDFENRLGNTNVAPSEVPDRLQQYSTYLDSFDKASENPRSIPLRSQAFSDYMKAAGLPEETIAANLKIYERHLAARQAYYDSQAAMFTGGRESAVGLNERVENLQTVVDKFAKEHDMIAPLVRLQKRADKSLEYKPASGIIEIDKNTLMDGDPAAISNILYRGLAYADQDPAMIRTALLQAPSQQEDLKPKPQNPLPDGITIRSLDSDAVDQLRRYSGFAPRGSYVQDILDSSGDSKAVDTNGQTMIDSAASSRELYRGVWKSNNAIGDLSRTLEDLETKPGAAKDLIKSIVNSEPGSYNHNLFFASRTRPAEFQDLAAHYLMSENPEAYGLDKPQAPFDEAKASQYLKTLVAERMSSKEADQQALFDQLRAEPWNRDPMMLGERAERKAQAS